MNKELVSQLIEAFFTGGGKVDADILPIIGRRLIYLTGPEMDAVISAIIRRIGPLEKTGAEVPLAQAA